MRVTKRQHFRVPVLKSTLNAMALCIALFLPARLAYSLPAVESRTNAGTTASATTAAAQPGQEPQSVHNTVEQKNLRYMVNQLEGLQQEVSNLRGLLEEQQQEIKQLKKSQESFYQDIDRRLGKGTENSPAKTASPKPNTVGAQNIASANSAASTTASTSSASEQDSYQKAYDLLRGKQYPEALTAFQDFNKRFPKSEQSASAYYWMGEIYLLQWQMNKKDRSLLEKSSQSFSSLKTNFSQHVKVADALYKLGLIEKEKGNGEGASKYFQELKSKYPNSAAARLAKD